MSRKYFGTDGVRGRVWESPITPEMVMHLGYAAGKVLAGVERRPAGDQQLGVEIALGRDPARDRGAGGGQVRRPVDADALRAGLGRHPGVTLDPGVAREHDDLRARHPRPPARPAQVAEGEPPPPGGVPPPTNVPYRPRSDSMSSSSTNDFSSDARRLADQASASTDRVADDALQLLGGYGYLAEYGVEKIVRDLRVHQILEGTNEIMRLIVARGLVDAR